MLVAAECVEEAEAEDEAVEEAAVALPEAGIEDSAAAVVKAAVRPVTFVQDDGVDVAVPATKLTAAHFLRLVLCAFLVVLCRFGTNLVEKPISGILDNINNTSRSGP
jgi:hypothetical protein